MVKRFEIEPADRDERLGEAVEQFMALAESGDPPDPETFASRYPELGEDLVEALEGLSLVRGLVGAPGEKGRRLEAGRRLAGYRIVRELGSGGMGVVYEAVHVDLDRPVALKVLDARATRDSNGLRRFQEEAKMAAGLHHTHIVPVFDVGHVGGLCYYAMQRIEGSGLDRVLRGMRRERTTAAGSGSVRPGASQTSMPPTLSESASGCLSWPATGAAAPMGGGNGHDDGVVFVPPRGSAYYRWVAEAGRQAGQALAHAHRRGVIHRDVKPSNLLVDSRGTIWVTDFGLARRLADPSLTRTDSLLGTPRYMSPEQARPGPIDGRTDVYSLGATLYEMLTLRPPFDGRTAAELIQQISDREPVHPRTLDGRIPRDLETIVLKALAKRASDRYADAAELADDLSRFLGREPVMARRIGPVGRAWRLAMRHPVASGALTAAAIVIVTVATIAYVRVAKERDIAQSAVLAKSKALQKLEVANQATEEARRRELLSSAAVVRMSQVSNRRERGLGLLSKAAALKPGRELRSELRDEAAQFLSVRDIEARPSIPVGSGTGIAFGASRNRVAVLSDDASELRFWDVAKREEQAQPVAARSRQDGPERAAQGPRRGEFGGPRRAMMTTRVASTGSLVAVVWQNGMGLHLVDASTGTVAFEMRTSDYEIVSVQASASAFGARLLTLERELPAKRGGAERDSVGEKASRPPPRMHRVNLWDTAHPEAPVATLATRAEEQVFGPPILFAISSDGETAATLANSEGIVSLWSGKDGKALGEIETNTAASALALGPDNVLAVAGGGAVRSWQLETKTPLPIIQPQKPFVTSMQFSPDGTLLAIAGGRDVELWDPGTDALVAALPTVDNVRDLAFSADGRTLIAGQSKAIAIWAVLEPTVRVHLSGLPAPATSLVFGPNGVLGMVSMWDGRPRFWDSGRCPTSAHDRTDFRTTALAADNNEWLAASGGQILQFSGSEPFVQQRKFNLPDVNFPGGGPRRPPFMSGVVAIARTPDGRAIAMNRTTEILYWNASEPDRVRTIKSPSARRSPRNVPYRNVALAPGGDRLYVLRGVEFQVLQLSGDRAERIDWNLPGEYTNMALSPDGKTIALSQSSGAVVLVDTAHGSVRSQLIIDESKDSQVTALVFSPDCRELAAGTKQGIVRLWQIDSNRTSSTPLVRLPGHRGAVISIAFDAAGSRLASAGDDKTVDVWDLAGLNRELKKLDLGW
jgi:serine/threonine protein kinase/WD40 repeat protein